MASAERLLKDKEPEASAEKEMSPGYLVKVLHFLFQGGKSSYEPVWPVSFRYIVTFVNHYYHILYAMLCFDSKFLVEQDMKFDWRIVVGTIVGFLGAALGSVGGVGGGGIFVPMLTLIIGFDPKSSTAISKCKYIDNSYF